MPLISQLGSGCGVGWSFQSLFSFFVSWCRATGGELFRVIAIDPLPENKAREVVHQIVDGVQHLHALNIVHLDLKVSPEV